MENCFSSDLAIHEIYDLKGSSVDRYVDLRAPSKDGSSSGDGAAAATGDGSAAGGGAGAAGAAGGGGAASDGKESPGKDGDLAGMNPKLVR
jgi:hypothetical protein